MVGFQRVNSIMPETSPRYVLSEVIQLLDLITMLRSLGKKIINKRVGESNLEEWPKRVLNGMR